MADAVAVALEELSATFPDVQVSVREDGEGGAFVIVEDQPLGPPYTAPTTWVGFRLAFAYPYSDVYPHYVRGDLARLDGLPLGEATSPTTFEGRAAIQLSRRSPKRDAALDSAVLKLGRVLEWLRNRP